MGAKKVAFLMAAKAGKGLKKIGNDGGKMKRRDFIKLLGLAPLVPKSACLNAVKPEPCAGLPEQFKIKADDMKYVQVGAWGFHPELAKQICGEDYRS